jgi:hypothetical protein
MIDARPFHGFRFPAEVILPGPPATAPDGGETLSDELQRSRGVIEPPQVAHGGAGELDPAPGSRPGHSRRACCLRKAS